VNDVNSVPSVEEILFVLKARVLVLMQLMTLHVKRRIKSRKVEVMGEFEKLKIFAIFEVLKRPREFLNSILVVDFKKTKIYNIF
jgi:hypothetical protein